MPENEAPTASHDRASRRDMDRGYRESRWEGVAQYECTRPPCWYGTYSRANTFDEAEMQAHQAQAHAHAGQ